MHDRQTGCAGLVPVQRLRPGDHAFVGYGVGESRWQVLTAYVWLGLARHEKVMVLADPDVPQREVLARLDAYGPQASAARARGQLVLSSMREVIRPDRAFTVDRQTARLREEIARARREGYTGLRTFIDMRWVPDMDADVAGVVHRETHVEDLFHGRAYTEVCAYDRGWFAPEVVEAMHDAHPRRLHDYLGVLLSIPDEDAVRFAGDADLTTLDQFRTALTEGLAQTADRGHMLLDLTHLHFLGVHCAFDLLRQVQLATDHKRIEIRCSVLHAGILRKLGAASVPRLTLSEVRVGC
ncbi:MEDS domain-containing protein [Streptomyces sp. NPDC101209]|uniref:MEDS domain-containing protein n=1 Tax=unclassified Streptomyces TaxID=2593676 RepID=UPI0036914128